jgi:hypothetical protein
MMRFGVFIIVTTPLHILHAQNSANVQDQTVQEQLEAMRKEIADLKRNANRTGPNTASPNTEQQGTGQNIGGTTTQESLLGGERRSMKTPQTTGRGRPSRMSVTIWIMRHDSAWLRERKS